MVRLYKDLNAIRIAGEIAFFILCFILSLLPHLHTFPCVAFVFLLFLGWRYLFERIAARRVSRAIRNYDECRARQGVEHLESLLKRCDNGTVYLIKAHLTFGYLLLGDASRTLELLDSLPPFPDGKRWLPLQFICEGNRGMACLMLGRLDDAEASNTRCAAILAQMPEKWLRDGEIQGTYQASLTELRMARGDFEGAADFYARRLPEAPTMRRKVYNHYMLAWALNHEGRNDEAREHLQFAAENGGDTWYAAAARKKLDTL